MTKQESLEALKKVVAGVLLDGRYVFITGDYEIQRAIVLCHKAGATIYEIADVFKQVKESK